MSGFPQKQLSEAYARARLTSFYRDRLGAGELNEASFKKIPLTTKADLRLAYPFGLLGTSMDGVASYHESSGTSGNPISSYFTERDWDDVYERFLRSRVALKKSDMVFIKTPYSLVTTAHQMHGAARKAGATVVPADNRSQNMPYSRVLRLLRDLPITVTWCLPTEAVIWAFLARKEGLDPAKDFPHLRALVVAGESLSNARRADISRMWGGKLVVEDYGSTETGSLAGECEEGHLHIWDDRLHFEVLDEESGATRSSGSGSLIVTPLYREAMPLIRYNLEDEVRIYSDECACGSKSARIEILGRKILKTQGFYPRELEEVIYSSGENIWFWRARASNEAIEVELHSETADRAKIQSEIEAKFARRAIVKSVGASRFVSSAWLREEQTMLKPRYVFSADEDWSKSASYF